jgi:hypothetical protein
MSDQGLTPTEEARHATLSAMDTLTPAQEDRLAVLEEKRVAAIPPEEVLMTKPDQARLAELQAMDVRTADEDAELVLLSVRPLPPPVPDPALVPGLHEILLHQMVSAIESVAAGVPTANVAPRIDELRATMAAIRFNSQAA